MQILKTAKTLLARSSMTLKTPYLRGTIQAFIAITCCILTATSRTHAMEENQSPNVIVIFMDDMGYGDLGCYGSTKIQTPNLDRMAQEGRKFTSFILPASVCTPSRAALLTGSYPKRVGLHEHVLFPSSWKGLNPSEYTMGNLFKDKGFATACIGKWHLGDNPETLPRKHGFDYYYGIPYSNDMNHPHNKGKPQGGVAGMDLLWAAPESTLTKCHTPLIENEEIIEIPVDQRTLTRRYTDKAIEFVTQNKDRPFFIYLPHSMPHIPLYVPDEVYDPNAKNAYTTVIEHVDSEVGRLIDTIRDLGLDEKTYVIFTSDNGPWLGYKHHAGSAGPLRKGKFSVFEGGHRVPCIIWAPGKIPAGTESDQLVSSMDLLPSFAAILGFQLPQERIIDGLDASTTLFTSESAESPRKELVYYSANGMLEGIRQGDWKLLMLSEHTLQKRPHNPEPIMLFNLSNDLSEEKNLANTHPEIIEKLAARMKELDAEITQNARSAWKR